MPIRGFENHGPDWGRTMHSMFWEKAPFILTPWSVSLPSPEINQSNIRDLRHSNDWPLYML